MGSAVFRRSPEPSINSLKHPVPDEIPREMSSLSQEPPNKSSYGSTKTDENVVSKLEKKGSLLSDTKKPRRGQSLSNKPDLHKVSRTGTSSVKSQENKEPLNEEVQPTEQELGTESNIEVPNSALQLKEFWLNMDQLCDLFDTIDVYHKPHTYPVKKTYENMIAAGSYTDRSPANGLYLFVDSIHPFEAIIGLSTICQWPPPLLKITERSFSDIELFHLLADWTPNQNTCPDSDHSFVTVNPPQARLIVEKVCCSRISGNPVKCLDINAHRAISLNLPAGRHCFSLIVCSPLGYRVTVLGSPVVTFSPASHVTPVLSEKTSDSLGPAVSREKSPRLSKLTKPRQRQPSPALVMETLFQPYQMELCDEDRLFNSCLTKVPTRVRNRAHAIVAGLLNLGRIYTSLYNEEQWSTILPRRDSIEQASSKDSSGILSEQQAHWLLQQYASRRKELESLILTNVPDKTVSHENPIGSKAFRRSLLAILQQLCCSGETGESLATPEMNLAWRVVQWDWTTDNPLNVTYRTPRGPTPTSRSKGRMRSALGEKQAQSIRKEGSEEEFQVRWSQPIDPDTLIAVVRIQAVFRGYHTRLCMRLRSPQTMVSFLVPSLRANSLSDTLLDNCDSPSYIRMKAALMRKAKRVESGWSKCLELLHRGQTEREIGVDLVQMLLEQNELEFGKDLERYIACLDFTGSQPARPSSGALNITEECKAKTEVSPKVQDWVALLFRDILTIGPQNEPKDGGLTKNFRMRFRTDLPDCQVQVVNNDTGQEVYTVFTGTVHPVSLKLNGNGYSLLGIGGPSPAPEGRWLLRLMAPGRNGLNGLPQIQNDWQRPLCTAFKARELTGYYVPNEKALLFRRHVEVDRDQLITVHLRLSAPSVPVRLSIFHSNQLVTAATGVGDVCVRTQLLRSTRDLPISQSRSLTKEDQSDSSSTGRRSVTSSARKTGKVSRQSSAGSSGRKSRESSVTSTSQTKRLSSREGHPLSGDRRSHIHPCWIEAHVDRNAWPLSLENWSFLVEQKQAQLEEFLARRQRETPTRQRTTTVATKSPKEKQITPTSEIDERQAHWKMRIILDATKLNEVRILPEENIAERVRAMKAAWEELEPGRAKRAALSHAILREDLPVEPAAQSCGEGFDSRARYTLDPPPSLSNTPSESFRLEKARLAETLGHIEQQRLEEAIRLLRLLDESSFIGTQYLKALNEEEITSDPSESVTLKQKVYNEFQKACDEAKECLKAEKTRERDMFILLMKTLQLLNDKSRAAYFESCEALRCKLLDTYRKEQEILKERESALDQPDSRTSSGRQRRKQRDSGKKSKKRNP
ncbi:Androglobin [Clonorchis sinensis]|uniref:Androglobin n=1 Tax=Clonorchis sinensis TaxID=79923 RepID=A0A8T1M5W4_CLOSI|nr:Androglobin [Clonorchis sinensis]